MVYRNPENAPPTVMEILDHIHGGGALYRVKPARFQDPYYTLSPDSKTPIRRDSLNGALKRIEDVYDRRETVLSEYPSGKTVTVIKFEERL